MKHTGIDNEFQCFGSHDDEKYLDDSLSDTWRLWLFQVCTEWGYFQVFINADFHCMQTESHTFGFKTAPPDQNHPRIVSRLVALESSSRICHQVLPNLFFTMTLQV